MIIGLAWHQRLAFGHCIANNYHPGPPPGEGAVSCSDLTVDYKRGRGPRIKFGAGPVSRSLRSLGRGYGTLDVGRRGWGAENIVIIKTYKATLGLFGVAY